MDRPKRPRDRTSKSSSEKATRLQSVAWALSHGAVPADRGGIDDLAQHSIGVIYG